VLNKNLSRFGMKVVAEEVSIEVITQACKKRVELFLGFREGPPREYVT